MTGLVGFFRELWWQILDQRRHARTGPRLSNAAVRRDKRKGG